MNINIKLAKHGLQQVQNFEYKIGHCLFDSIAYLLNYSISSKLIQKNSMCYFTKMFNNWYTFNIGMLSM